MKAYKVLIYGALLFIGIGLKAQTLNLKFTNIRNNNGVFRVGIFTNEVTYKSGDPKYYITLDKEHVINGEVHFILDTIAPG